MKKIVLLLVLAVFILLNVSCQKVEEVTLSKYFQAMKNKDNDTLSAMAAEPVAFEINSWKMLSSEEPASENLVLPNLILTMTDLKKQRDDQVAVVRDALDAKDSLKTQVDETRNKRQKAELQTKLDEAIKKVSEETEKFKILQSELGNAKNEVDVERRLMQLSTSIEQNQEAFSGKMVTFKTHVLVKNSQGDKEYIITLRRYDLVNPTNNKTLPARLVILKIENK